MKSNSSWLPPRLSALRSLQCDCVRLHRDPVISKGRTPQPQRVANNRDGAEAHGCRRNHRAQKDAKKWIEHASGNRYSYRVVDEREEEILFDVAHRGATQTNCAYDAAQVSFDQSDA